MKYKKTIMAVAVFSAFTISSPSFALSDAGILAPLIKLTTVAVNGTTAAVTSGFTTVMQALLRIENTMSANSAKVANQIAESNQNQVERNIDVALQEVQTKVAQAARRLPEDVDPPTISKTNPHQIV